MAKFVKFKLLPIATGICIFLSANTFAGEFVMPEIKGMPSNPKLVLACPYPDLLPGLKSIEKDFQNETGIELEVQAVKNDFLEQWYRCQLISKTPPAVFIGDKVEFFETLAASGHMQYFNKALEEPNPFTDSSKPWKDYFNVSMLKKSMNPAGNYVNIPFTRQGVAFFYNKDLFTKLGIETPETWKEFMDLSHVILENKKTNNGPDCFVTSTIGFTDGQSDGFYRTIYELLMRPHIEEINIRRAPDWKYDYTDPSTTKGDERIDANEWIVAFEKGLTDPAKSPEWRETVQLLLDWSETWNEDFSTISDGNIPYEAFVKGDAAMFMAGSSYFETLVRLQKVFAEIKPELLFEYGTFLFPPITSDSTDFELLGEPFQQVFPKGRIFVAKQTKDLWKNEAALLLTQYITTPRVAQKIWDEGINYDVSCIEGIVPKPEASAFADIEEVADLEMVYPWGYDAMSGDDYRNLRYKLFNKELNLDEYLDAMSKSHRESLKRYAEFHPDEIDHQFIKEQLGRDFN